MPCLSRRNFRSAALPVLSCPVQQHSPSRPHQIRNQSKIYLRQTGLTTALFNGIFQDHHGPLSHSSATVLLTTIIPVFDDKVAAACRPRLTTTSQPFGTASSDTLRLSSGSHFDQTNFESEGSTTCDTTVSLYHDAVVSLFTPTPDP